MGRVASYSVVQIKSTDRKPVLRATSVKSSSTKHRVISRARSGRKLKKIMESLSRTWAFLAHTTGSTNSSVTPAS